MYPPHGQQGQQGQPGQPGQRTSQQWDPRDSQSVQYQQPPNPAYAQPPPAGSHPRPEMASVHPQQYSQPPEYRLPPPNQQYYGPPDYRQPMPNAPYDHRQPMHNGPDSYRPPMQNVTQSAPRQRTAIACKYCRRRKIRCSGFENSEDGRCSNCLRFTQECVFTPVSSQAQAFVPAQALYNRQMNGRGPHQQQPTFYGAYGQPLPRDVYPPAQYPGGPPGQYPPQQPMYAPGPYPQHPQPGYPGYDQNGMSRRADDPHNPALPPPNHGQPQAQGQGYSYPDPTPLQGAVSPSTSSQSYNAHPQQTPYYSGQEPPRRNSPQSQYQYDNRGSGSPHTQPGYQYASGQPTLQTQAPAPRSDGRTPPPPSAASEQGRPGMSIRDIVVNENGNNSHSPGERNHTDNDMVSALNRRGGPQNGAAGTTRRS